VKNPGGSGELVRASLRVSYGRVALWLGDGSSESCSLGRRICGLRVMLKMI